MVCAIVLERDDTEERSDVRREQTWSITPRVSIAESEKRPPQ
jgi:hypothetical protein